MKTKCACGCGNEFTPSRATAWRIKTGLTPGFILGHRFRGELNSRWNGGRATTEQGYVLVQAPENHPNARVSGYILEHRLVMERKIGRPLLDAEIVHHINGDKTDNRPENLAIMNRSSHASHHGPEQKQPLEPKVCLTCGKAFVHHPSNHKRDKFCSRACIQGIAPKGAAHHAAKLNAALVRQIRRRASDGETHQAIADSIGIGRGTVSKITRHEAWAHVR